MLGALASIVLFALVVGCASESSPAATATVTAAATAIGGGPIEPVITRIGYGDDPNQTGDLVLPRLPDGASGLLPVVDAKFSCTSIWQSGSTSRIRW